MNASLITNFCINLDRRSDRWESMQKRFKEQNLQVHRWSAIDAREYWFSNPTGAFSSHINLLYFCSLVNTEYALIFEDDVVLCDNFLQKLQEVLGEIPSDWDALSLHCFKAETCKISNYLCKLMSPTAGNHAVLINNKGIHKVLNNTHKSCIEEKYFESLDNFYAVNLEHTMAFQTGEDSDIPETSIINEYRQLCEQHSHNLRSYRPNRQAFQSISRVNYCIVRPTYYDRSAMLQLSLEYQKDAINHSNAETYIFVDPHNEHGIVSDYDKVITDEYKRIDWKQNSGKYSWYDSVKYIFENTNYEYVLSIEDDVLISKDYLRLCEQLFHDTALIKDDNILYFHSGAWEKPKGNPNKIVRSGVSSRSILIYRKKFGIIKKWVEEQKNRQDFDPIWSIKDNDHMINNILKDGNMTTIAPENNRHGHVGIYGWSATKVQKVSHDGQSALFDKPLSHEELYSLLKENCLSGSKLRELNQNKNPNYFWDFDPNINFTKLEYHL